MITIEMQKAIKEKVDACLFIAKKRWAQVDFRPPVILYDVRGTMAGYAVYHENKIRLNPILLRENFQSFLDDTVPHELAHLVARRAFMPRPIQPHGMEWRSVMYLFGLKPERCHKYDTTNASCSSQRKFGYSCACKTHAISTTIHRRIQSGRNYFCKICKEMLEEI